MLIRLECLNCSPDWRKYRRETRWPMTSDLSDVQADGDYTELPPVTFPRHTKAPHSLLDMAHSDTRLDMASGRTEDSVKNGRVAEVSSFTVML
ncbi:hypothetical protein ElyMa_000800600 [Elysia marginata]|uniref:Spondin domain-containing protein n=1 Tax=Elysia marginata TaxID=1093978 RepID=A0AAV4GXP2_9GAST|nr:hypothetical protein ElyMa_000800600 [Elysia marginata]